MNEIDLQEQIGTEVATNVINQYGMTVAISFPTNPNSNFQNICEEIRGTW